MLQVHYYYDVYKPDQKREEPETYVELFVGSAAAVSSKSSSARTYEELRASSLSSSAAAVRMNTLGNTCCL